MVQNDVIASFIIPVYNTQKYLERCLTSVTAIQNKSIEILIIDDGSTDKSVLIYDKYAKLDRRIIILSKENGGVSSARNRGIQAARGRWIAFIDSDDEIVPTVYDSLLSRLDERFELYILGVMLRYPEVNESVKEVAQGVWEDEDVEAIKRGIFHQDTKFVKKVKSQGFDLRGPVAKFYQKKIIKENNIKFSEKLAIGEDCVFNFLYLNYVNVISYENVCAYYYWQNASSVMHKFTKGKGKQHLVILEEIYDILKDDYLLEYSQFGVRQYLYALKSDWCHTDNCDVYSNRKKEAINWRENMFVQEAFHNFKFSQIRWEAFPIACCAKMKCFLLCDLLLKIKEKLHIRFV